MRKISADPPSVVFPGPHVYEEDLPRSALPKEWQSLFREVLEAKNEVMAAIPGQRQLSDMRTIRILSFKRGPFVKLVRHLMDSVKGIYPDADWPGYEDGFRKLVTYEFMMNPMLPREINEWVFNMHSLVSALFTLMNDRIRAEGNQISTRVSSLVMRIACRIAGMPPSIDLTKRDHVTQSDVNNSSLDPELKRAFKNALEAKSDFQSYSMDLIYDPSAVKNLEFAKDSVTETTKDLISLAKKMVENFDSSRIDAAVDTNSGYKLTSNIAETNVWSSRAHEVLTALFEELVEKNNGKNKEASWLVKIVRQVAKIAAGTIYLRDSMMHVEPGEIDESSLDDEMKSVFKNAFEVKRAFQKLIPMNPKLIDERMTDKLDDKAGTLVFTLEGLATKVADAGKTIDEKTKSALKKLDEYGFIPSSNVSREINDWMWDAHEILSKLFDIATDKEED